MTLGAAPGGGTKTYRTVRNGEQLPRSHAQIRETTL